MRLLRAPLLSLALMPMLLGVAPGAKPGADAPEMHRGIEYRGAAGFVFLPRITVVYPAAEGEPVEVNRRSAESRARWLVSVYKCKVEVAADDQLTEEQKKGNLLLLGWSNRFFVPPGPARPFAHGRLGLTFLGLKESDPAIDLIVYHANPLNWSSYILFWSRLDAERDRFQILPRVGSDWAMYRNFEPIRQGMFLPGHVWPPLRDKAAEADQAKEALVRSGGIATFDSAHYRITYDRAQFKSDEINAIAQAREAALSRAVAAIGPLPNGFRIKLYVYPDEAAKREATGVDDPTHSVPGTREMYATKPYALALSPREEVHVLARELYGPCYISSIHEGLAFATENSLRGETMETHAARLRASHKLPTLSELLDEETFRALPPDIRAAAAGVFMAWLRQTYGPSGVKKIYGLADGRTATLAASLGVTEDQLFGSYAAWADTHVAAGKNDLDFRAAEAEAQQRMIANDWSGMVVALRKALQAKPGDPQTLFNLASAQMRAGDLTGAESSLKQILAAPLTTSESRFRIFGHYQLGRVYDLAGRRADAVSEYDAVLALPDDHGAHALALERKASPATREQLD